VFWGVFCCSSRCWRRQQRSVGGRANGAAICRCGNRKIRLEINWQGENTDNNADNGIWQGEICYREETDTVLEDYRKLK
jgi:hypothetical protein